ncbi:MAG: alpha/beta fold hydrolase [Bacteroidota bacterium]|nr:alpha/beta fold hydrolase [Bacteroidota bacterium]
MNFFRLIKTGFFAFSLALFISCGNDNELPVTKYYEYDPDLPLLDSVYLLTDTTDYQLFYLTYRSVHDKKVTGLLTLPKKGEQPLPTVILMHGLGDRKTVDYIEAGNQYLLNAGYAVLRLDISNHGDRFKYDYDFDLTDGYRYWTRDLITQTVFDLRRAVDFIQTREELDPRRIGYMGISLGGIIGTIFCSVEERIEVPVIVLAGGKLNLMFGKEALSGDTKDYLSIIDPINYVARIAPRPLLMINAENDDVVPPITSKLLFNAAKKPKEIIWYPAKHHDIPIDKVYPDGIRWFNDYLK